jgi:hypothetical protein
LVSSSSDFLLLCPILPLFIPFSANRPCLCLCRHGTELEHETTSWRSCAPSLPPCKPPAALFGQQLDRAIADDLQRPFSVKPRHRSSPPRSPSSPSATSRSKYSAS